MLKSRPHTPQPPTVQESKGKESSLRHRRVKVIHASKGDLRNHQREQIKKIKRIRTADLSPAREATEGEQPSALGKTRTKVKKRIIKDHRLAGLSGTALVWPVTGSGFCVSVPTSPHPEGENWP